VTAGSRMLHSVANHDSGKQGEGVQATWERLRV
jgi:hypothetical protein